MLETCKIDIKNNEVVIIDDKPRYLKPSYIKTSDRKYEHLKDIGMDLSKYHPSVITNIVGGASDRFLDIKLKPDVLKFVLEAKSKLFKPQYFGYNTKLHKMIKGIDNINKDTISKPNSDKIIKKDNTNKIINNIEALIKEGKMKDAKIYLKNNKINLTEDKYKSIKEALK
jgi:hypothetical protein